MLGRYRKRVFRCSDSFYNLYVHERQGMSFMGIQIVERVITNEKLLIPIFPQHCVPVFLVFEGNRKNLTASGGSVSAEWFLVMVSYMGKRGYYGS